MHNIKTSAHKGRSPKSIKLFAMGFLCLAFIFFIYYIIVSLSSDVSASQLLNPFGEVQKSALPNVPKIARYDEIFYKIRKLDLGLSQGIKLPVESGNKGKANPFYVQPKDTDSGNNTSGGGNGGSSAVGGGSSGNTISDGSK